MRQAEGGDFDVLPEPTAYVNEVGQKLAAVADRKLPYEFVVLNNSRAERLGAAGRQDRRSIAVC